MVKNNICVNFSDEESVLISGTKEDPGPNVIAMGFPASNYEAIYRYGPIKQLFWASPCTYLHLQMHRFPICCTHKDKALKTGFFNQKYWLLVLFIFDAQPDYAN